MVGTVPGPIADKITASNFRQKKTGDQTSEIESQPEVNLPKPNEVYFDEATKKKLSEIIEEINATYNKSFDACPTKYVCCIAVRI